MLGNLTIVGGKGSSGDFEGNAYDSTKLNVLLPYSRNNENAFGMDAIPAKFGKSANAKGFKTKRFPLILECDYEMVPSGQGVVIEIYEVIKITESAAPLAQAQK